MQECHVRNFFDEVGFLGQLIYIYKHNVRGRSSVGVNLLVQQLFFFSLVKSLLSDIQGMKKRF